MNNQELKDKILNILQKSGSVEDMVFDQETIDQISEVVTAIKAKNAALRKSNYDEDKKIYTPTFKAVISPNGQWSLEKASNNIINYKTMSTPKEDIKAKEAKAAKFTYDPKNPTSAPVYTPALDSKKEKKPKEEKVMPAVKPAIEEIKTRQTSVLNNPPTPPKNKKL